MATTTLGVLLVVFAATLIRSVTLPTIFLGRWMNHRMRGDAFVSGVDLHWVALLKQAIRRGANQDLGSSRT